MWNFLNNITEGKEVYKMLQIITSKGIIKILTEQQTNRLLEIAKCQTIEEFLNTEGKYFDCKFKIVTQ